MNAISLSSSSFGQGLKVVKVPSESLSSDEFFSSSSSPQTLRIVTTSQESLSSGFNVVAHPLENLCVSQLDSFLKNHPDPKFSRFFSSFSRDYNTQITHLLDEFCWKKYDSFKQFLIDRGEYNFWYQMRVSSFPDALQKKAFIYQYLPALFFVFLEKNGSLDEYCLEKILPRKNNTSKHVLLLLFDYLRMVKGDFIAHERKKWTLKKQEKEKQRIDIVKSSSPSFPRMQYAPVPKNIHGVYSDLLEDAYNQELWPSLSPSEHAMYLEQSSASQRYKK